MVSGPSIGSIKLLGLEAIDILWLPEAAAPSIGSSGFHQLIRLKCCWKHS
jgi:hypothetical protein